MRTPLKAALIALYVLALIVSLVLAVVGIWKQVEVRRPATPATHVAAPTYAPTPLTVSLSALTSWRVAAVGASTFFSVSAAGSEISEVRLYDGSALVGVHTFTPHASERVAVSMEWPTLRAGVHVLHATAIGADPSQVGHSAPLRMRAEVPVVAPPTMRIPANGRTAEQVAEASGVPVEHLTFSAEDQATAPPKGAAASGVVAVTALNRIPRELPPVQIAATDGAIKLQASIEGCRATITAEAGVTIYEATGGTSGFVRRGAAPYSSGELTPGPHVFVGGLGDAPADSAPVTVTAPANCQEALWSGPARLLDAELTLRAPEPQVWVYLGVDGRPFQRIPAKGTVSAAFGTADLAGLLPSLRGSEVKLEVWRPGETPAGPATLVAQSGATFRDPGLVTELLGSAPAIELSSERGLSADLRITDTSLRFHWRTESPSVTGVLWQVLGRPLQAADRNTAPPVMLATGFAETGAGEGLVLSGYGGDFRIPAKLLLGGRPATSLGDTPLFAVPTPSVTQLLTPGSMFGTTPITDLTPNALTKYGAGLVTVPVGDVFVRVLPLFGGAVVGDASNTVSVTLPELSETTAGFTVKQVLLDPGHGVNYNLSNCVRVTGTPKIEEKPKPSWGGFVQPVAPTQFFASIYKADGTYCPGDFKTKSCGGWCKLGKAFTAIVEVVSKVWDYIAAAYNTVVDTLITVIAAFNPLCLTASVASAVSKSKYADSAAKGCNAISKAVTAVAVGVVLASFGLPAHLPNSAELAEIAKGDLTAIAVQYLETLGVPCSDMKVDATVTDSLGAEVPKEVKGADGGVDVCAAMISQAIGAIQEQVKQVAKAEVSNTSGLPHPPSPQVMVLEPRGRYQGAVVRVIAEPIDPNTLPTARCYVRASGSIDDWTGGNQGPKARTIGSASGWVARQEFGPFTLKEPWQAVLHMAPVDELQSFESISGSLSSPCFPPASIPSIPRTKLKPPLGYWYPGQAD